MTSNLQNKRKWSEKRRHFYDFQTFEEFEAHKEAESRNFFSACMVIGSMVLALILILCAPAFAGEIPEDTAVRILIGEAANQGEKGMVCVAEVLRKRGSIKGFYGINAKHINSQPGWVWEQAKRAWRKSASTNYTNNATHYENIHAFGKPYWTNGMKVVFKYKDHTFYAKRRG